MKMKTNENIAKIFSAGTVLVLCFAIGLFALLMLGDRTASAHAYVSLHPMDASSSPSSGPIGATISVNGSGLAPTGASVVFGYSTNANCATGFNAANTSNSNPTVQANGSFSGWFVWPPETVVGTYTVCVEISSASNTIYATASSYQVLSTSAPSVSVDHSSYKAGDNISVTGSNFYPSGTAVTIKLEAPGRSHASTLGNPVTTDKNGSFTHVYKAPGSPTGTLVIVATGGSGSPPPLQATSSQFDIKKIATATPIPPPPVFVATPTPAPAPTAAPSPAVAPAPTPVRVVVTHTTSPSGNLLGGRLPMILAIGFGTLLALGILFVVGRLVLHKYLLPVSLPKMPPSGALPWSRSREESLHGNMMMNDVPFARTMPYNNLFPPGYRGVVPGSGYGPPQQVPFNGPVGPGNGGVAPGPGNSPFPPGNSGVVPGNVAQEPFPPNDRFPPPN